MSTITQRESDQREATVKTETQRHRPFRISVAKYEAMVASGAFTKADRFELIEGILVEKMTKNPPHSVVVGLCQGGIDRRSSLAGTPGRNSRYRSRTATASPSPTWPWSRAGFRAYLDHHPGPADVALIVEVADSSLADDRAMASTYGGGGILAYWIVNVAGRQFEVYANPSGSEGDISSSQDPGRGRVG